MYYYLSLKVYLTTMQRTTIPYPMGFILTVFRGNLTYRLYRRDMNQIEMINLSSPFNSYIFYTIHRKTYEFGYKQFVTHTQGVFNWETFSAITSSGKGLVDTKSLVPIDETAIAPFNSFSLTKLCFMAICFSQAKSYIFCLERRFEHCLMLLTTLMNSVKVYFNNISAYCKRTITPIILDIYHCTFVHRNSIPTLGKGI